MKSFRLFLATIALAVLGACASLGVPPADTFNKQLAAGYTTVSAVSDAATSAVTAGKLSKDDAKKVLASVQVAELGLETAFKLHSTDPAGANTKLQATIAALAALQAYLATQGAK